MTKNTGLTRVPPWLVAAVGVLIIIGVLVYALLPLCEPIPEETIANFNPPIEERQDRDVLTKVFQEKDGQWYYCTSRFSRNVS